MDISFMNPYPSNSISNFARNEFVIDDVKCQSMEGFLQSLKFEDVVKQKEVCNLYAKRAKDEGTKRADWMIYQRLWWKGIPFLRGSIDYQKLLTRAYNELAKNDRFIRALKATGTENLTHKLGRNEQAHTILTIDEFLEQLNRLRNIHCLGIKPEKKMNATSLF